VKRYAARVSTVGLALAAVLGTLGTPAAAAQTPDFIGERLEVTQSVQNLDNGVPLVRGKRTYVRFYARVAGGAQVQQTNAVLVVSKGGQQKILWPLNTGGKIYVSKRAPIEKTGWWVRMASPAASGAPALFELPHGFTEGTVTLTAAVNPNLCFGGGCPPPEPNTANNVVTKAVTFEAVLGAPVIWLYNVRYTLGGTTHLAPGAQVKQLASWLQSAYPAAKVPFLDVVTLDWPKASSKTDKDGNTVLTNPTCSGVNFNLSLLYFAPLPNERRYGMVHDGGGFMRGCAPAPGKVASGPTGTGSWGWDFDGSYGDWYGGHELAHSFGRKHVRCTGTEDGAVAYPYPDGRISPVSSPTSSASIVAELFGFDTRTRTVYPPWWKDVMTYCDNQWIGDVTYKGLKATFQKLISEGRAQAWASGRAPDGALAAPATLMRVVGRINARGSAAELGPVFTEELADAPDRRPAGRYTLVLRGPGGAVLARHRVRPMREHPGPPPPWAPRSTAAERLVVREALPLPARAAELRSLELRDPGGKLLARRRAGGGAPIVELTAPSGGETFERGPVEVRWEASDPDGDPLQALVQFRAGPDEPWKSVALTVRGGRSASIPFANLPSGREAAFRVLVSDGLHTGVAQTPSPFTVANEPPEVEIVSPRDGDVVLGEYEVPLNGEPTVVSQPLFLEAFAQDADLGVLDDESLGWASSVDGPLGTGARLTVAELTPGPHVLTVEASDGKGGIAHAEVAITVAAAPDELPQPQGLLVDPGALGLAPHNRRDRAPLTIAEAGLRELRWSASANRRWLRLSAESGSTPGQVTVSLARSLLPAGSGARGRVVFTSPDLPDARVTVPVEVDIARCARKVVTRLGTERKNTFRGSRSADVMLLLGGADTAFGGAGADVLCGGRGGDTLTGGQGRDVLVGEEGNDALRARDGAPDTVDCGPGRDVAIVDRLDRVRRCETVRVG